MAELLDMPQSDYKHFNTVIEENLELSKKSKQVILWNELRSFVLSLRSITYFFDEA